MIRKRGRYLKLFRELIKIRLSKTINKDAEFRRAIFYTFKDWGGVYIKFLQILAGTSKFMEGWGGPREMQIFAQAPREELDLARYIDLNLFTCISDKPVAAGSFALVYRGKLKSGEDVAVKILRPSIQKYLKHDLAVLRRLCKLFARFLPQYLLNYSDAYDACAKMFVLETDYRREIANQEYFAKLYQNHPYVKIPKVFTGLSSKNVIVQEFIDGPALSDVMSNATPDKPATILAKEMTGSDLWVQVVVAGGEALRTAMCCDYVYGDPHPGNIILLPNNKIALIDFGIISNKPSSHRAFYEWVRSYYDILDGQGSFQELIEATVTCFVPDFSLAMRRCNFNSGDLLSVLAGAVSDKIDSEMGSNKTCEDSFRDGHLIDVFMKVVSTKVIEVEIEMINFELLKAIQAFLGAVTILDNSENNHGFAKIMFQSMEYAIREAKKVGIPNDMVRKTRLSLTDTYELLVKTISSLADNDEVMFDLVQERMFA